jgi:hypothetical protein
MKKIIIYLTFLTIIAISCKKENNTVIVEQKPDLYESNLAFINSDWTFNATGDSVKDQIIGLWLSEKVSYNGTLCNDCDSLFTWVIESTGRMIKRNNDWGDNETLYGDWRTDTTEEFVLFSYKMYDNGGTLNNYIIMTDTISFEYVNQSNLLTSQIINNQSTTQISIEFNKLK